MDTNTLISEIMTPSPITAKPDDSLLEIQATFDQYPFHHIPVIGKGQKVLGIVSKTDLTLYLKNLSQETTGKSYTAFQEAGTLAKDIMTSNLTTLDPDDSVGLAADIFLANLFHAIPIVDDGQLVGILTNHDLLQYAYKGVLSRK